MPAKYCVAGCRTNYAGGPKRSFPSDKELWNKWIHFLNQSNWTLAHFEDKYIFLHKKIVIFYWDIKPMSST